MSAASLTLIKYGDGYVKCIYKSKSKRLQLKIILSAQDTVVRAAPKIFFDYARPSVILYLGCNFLSVIYLIRCFLQCWAKVSIKNFIAINHVSVTLKNEFCSILSNHFHKGLSKNAPDTVQILEQIDGNGRPGIGALDASMT